MADELNLLRLHTPLYHFDKLEKYPPVSMHDYVFNKRAVTRDNTCVGVVSPTGDGKTLLHYFLWYTVDGGLEFLGVTAGEHPYDIEQLVVELTAGAVTGVLYMPHGQAEHFWIRGKDLGGILREGRPVVYCSKGKHGQYPVPGTIWRYFGMANDACDPVAQNVTVVKASAALLRVKYIDGSFRALPGRLTIPAKRTLALDQVYRSMYWQRPLL